MRRRGGPTSAPTRPSDYRAPDYVSYPTGPVVRVGLTDRLLEEYPNIYGDISAGSGLGALTRDPRVRARLRAPAPDQATLGDRLPLPRRQRQLGRGPAARVLCSTESPRCCATTACRRTTTPTSRIATRSGCWGCRAPHIQATDHRPRATDGRAGVYEPCYHAVHSEWWGARRRGRIAHSHVVRGDVRWHIGRRGQREQAISRSTGRL